MIVGATTGLFLVPDGLVFGSAGAVLCYLAFHLLSVRGGSVATRCLGLTVAAAALNALSGATWKSTVEWTPAPVWSAVGLAGVTLFLVLFAYRFPVDDCPRERRIATWVFGILAAASVIRSLLSAGNDTSYYDPFQYLVRRIASDPARAGSAPFVVWWFSKGALLVPYAWGLLVLLRKCRRIERAAGTPALRALIVPRTRAGRAARDFAALSTGLLLVPLLSLWDLGWAVPILGLFITSASVWVHVNHSAEPTPVRFKLVAIPLAGVVGLIGMALSRIAEADIAAMEVAAQTATARVRARVAAADPPGGEGIRPGVLEIPEGIAFVVSRARSPATYPMEFETHFARPDVDISTLVESNRLEEDYRRRFAIDGLRRREPGLSPADAAAAVDARLATGAIVNFFPRIDGTFYGSLLPPGKRWITRRFEHGDRVFEVGWSETERRAAIHRRVLPFALLVLGIGVFIVAGLPLLFRASVLGPLGSLLAGVRRVESGDLDARVEVRTGDEFGLLARAFEGMVASIRAGREELERTNRAAFRFVPLAFLRQLGHDSILDAELGQQRRARMTVLFADIRDFTTLAESLTPEETFAFVNAFLSGIGPAIRAHGGFIDKYFGDAVMALFPESADDAVGAAVAMQADVERFNGERAGRGEAPIRIGIGLHTGDLILGIIGEDERLDGTVIADAVNTASRLEGLTKRYRAGILMSGETLAGLAHGDRVPHRFVDRVQVKGRDGAIDVLEVLAGEDAGRVALLRGNEECMARGWAAWVAGRFDEAAAEFTAAVDRAPADPVARLHLDRALARAGTTPPPGWDGVHRMEEK